MALRVKGESADEIAGCAEAMREHVLRISPARSDLVDTAGTGGDGSNTFNISTAAALVAAAAGAGVAKHGNRAASSSTGAADVLEALGFDLALPPRRIEQSIDELGFGFLFAQAHHPAMRHAAPVRRELAARTVFNVLGPLTNPAGARAQVVGVYAPGVARTIAAALVRLDARRAYVVHGAARDRRAVAGRPEPRLRGRRAAACANTSSTRSRARHPALRPGRAARRRPGDERARPSATCSRGADGGHRSAVLLNAAGADRRRRPCRRPARGPRPRPRGDRLGRRRRAPRPADHLLASGGRMSHVSDGAVSGASHPHRTVTASGGTVKIPANRRRRPLSGVRHRGSAPGRAGMRFRTRWRRPDSGRLRSSSAARLRPATCGPTGTSPRSRPPTSGPGRGRCRCSSTSGSRGTWDDLRAARAATSLPLLAKGFFSTPEHLRTAAEAGADAVLLHPARPRRRRLPPAAGARPRRSGSTRSSRRTTPRSSPARPRSTRP